LCSKAFDPSNAINGSNSEYWSNNNQEDDLQSPGSKRNKESAREKQQNLLDWVNQLWKEQVLERNGGLEQLGQSTGYASADDDFHQNPHLRPLFKRCLPGSRFSSLAEFCLPQCVPLNECVLDIVWDFTYCSTYASTISGTSKLEELANLLPRAASYQAEHQEVISPKKKEKQDKKLTN
jgi:hypothetical protein